MDNYSFLGSVHGAYISEIHEQYLKDPDSVEPTWRSFFQGFDFAREIYTEEEVLEQLPEGFSREFKVLNLINGYRTRGHLFTKTNPVRERRKYSPTLALENFDLGENDLDTVFEAGTQIGLEPTTLRNIIAHLEQVYCQSIGVEYMYIRKPEEVRWIQNELQQNYNTPAFDANQKKHILHKLNQAVAFESFLHTKFVGQKRFSLEGAESLIPALDGIIERGAELGIEEFVMGMAHRGRLNVLANIFGKTVKDIFNEFEGKEYEDSLFDGDVKYHLGFNSDRKADSGKNVKMVLAPNPSHLEAVNPVVEGIARAKINNDYDGSNDKVMPILIHGDAAIAAQGVVYEVIQMEQLDGYKTGGTVHIVVNNQVGFTTNYTDARSSTYCTDIAKVTLSPVLHVNGDDVEAVVHAVQFAVNYRQKFHKDVFIDLLCYRKYGHNEGDEPRFTQPKLYSAIAKHPNPREIYNEKLIEEGVVTSDVLKQMQAEFKSLLEERFDEAKQEDIAVITPFMKKIWKDYRFATSEDFDESIDTSFDIDTLKHIGEVVSSIPDGKNIFRKLVKLQKDRRTMLENNALDWGMAEQMAYGSLLVEGHNVRLSGQDSERGTFSHRHAVLKAEDSEEEFMMLNHINDNQARFAVYNSLLSEYGVLGFDYGYALACPQTLTIWEAQFGDFNNGAQIMIDQFITAAEDKWKIQNGLVMLLPHGYEGQGAEHSSARLERFLQMCAEDNIQVANATTPANFFHLIRRQMKRDFRKPLIVMSPKSLLRGHTSTIEELANGKFKEVIDDTNVEAKNVKTLAFCSGKLYYELEAEREKRNRNNIAFVRIEQLYPLPHKQLKAIIEKYNKAEKYLWVQEEPENMGAWTHMLRHFRDVKLDVISRHASAAPASGSSKRAAKRQQEIIEKTFTN